MIELILTGKVLAGQPNMYARNTFAYNGFPIQFV